jgi:hypothetical protein
MARNQYLLEVQQYTTRQRSNRVAFEHLTDRVDVDHSPASSHYVRVPTGKPATLQELRLQLP